MQIHWQFLITNPGFWLVNILLRELDTLSLKEMKMIRTQFFHENKKKNAKNICRVCPIDPWCNILQTLETRRIIIKKKQGFTKEGLQFEERLWTEGWTTVQRDGSFHAVTKALDNHTCESHVTGVYKTTYHHML